MKKLRLAALLSIGLLLLAPLQTFAIENGGVGGRPANPDPSNPRTTSIFIYQLKPGEEHSDGVLVSNNTASEQTVSVYAVDSILSSGGAFACKQAVEPKNDVGSWITLQSDSVTVAAGSSQVVPFTISVPANASVGEHDGCIALQAASQTAKSSGANGVVLSFRSAIRVAVTIPGKIIKKLTLVSVQSSPTKDNKLLVVPTVRNDGNVSLDITTQINLLPLFGGASVRTKEGSSPVLPHSSESWQYVVKRPFWGGLYRAKVTAVYDSNPNGQLGSKQQATPKTVELTSTAFFVTPAPIAVVIELAVLLALLLFIVWLVRRYVKSKQIRRHWQTYTVKTGDTLQSLAAAHGVSWRQVAKSNKLKPPYHLEKGHKIILPPTPKE
ncbi:MAG TPA: LysM peptidoglycan-binding domain-containing protein [Candidatus Saccharimonadales bacterium]|nr:LysM peptidoglycan-binding domain-containing protein [Candidatus Saccharimonadales bacterium]